jgi:hypothetical protein
MYATPFERSQPEKSESGLRNGYSDYPHLAQRLFNAPLAITPDKLEIVMAAPAGRFGPRAVLTLQSDPIAAASVACVPESPTLQ